MHNDAVWVRPPNGKDHLTHKSPDMYRNALAVALFLEHHDAVDRVLYPGLPSHPQHDLAQRQQHGFGAMITFYCRGGRDQSAAFLKSVGVQ